MDPDGTSSEPDRPFSQFLDVANLILLGDPGAGKSHLFRAASELEEAALFEARNFLIYATREEIASTIYVDALDEKRSRIEGLHSFVSIVHRIVEVNPVKVRLSCRAADWLGDTDLALLKPYFDANGGYAVLVLRPLDDEQMYTILSEEGVDHPQRFHEEARTRGVSNLLRNPQTLIMLAESVRDGEWPKTKKQLYEQSTRILEYF